MKKLALLLTCHNRKSNTLECLKTIYEQELAQDHILKVYLVDDGSTDGTGQAVGEKYPQAVIIKGDGGLYYVGGMRLAFEAARKDDPDFYVFMNDDTYLYKNSLKKLLETHDFLFKSCGKELIVVGATCDETSGKITYGGVKRRSFLRPLKFDLILPADGPQSCDTMNGNCFLVPKEVAASIGNYSEEYRHYLADYDYGLRARQKGFQVWVASGFAGTCSANVSRDDLFGSNISHRLKKLSGPKGLGTGDEILPSIREWKVFAMCHGGPFWLIFWLLPYRRLMRRPSSKIMGKAAVR